MFAIGVRINHGVFCGVKKMTNHNFFSDHPIKIGEKVRHPALKNKVGEVYQCNPTRKMD